MGTFQSAKQYVLHTFATTESALMKKRVSRYIVAADCPLCHGKRLRREPLLVTFAGLDIAELSNSRSRRSPRPSAGTPQCTRQPRGRLTIIPKRPS